MIALDISRDLCQVVLLTCSECLVVRYVNIDTLKSIENTLTILKIPKCELAVVLLLNISKGFKLRWIGKNLQCYAKMRD
jgi:hypothetical protein